MLRKNQLPIREQIVENLPNGIQHNIPTGTGKTWILNDAAVDAHIKYSKKVIISVPNNALVREMYKVGVEHYDSCEHEIKIGRDNYISRIKINSKSILSTLKKHIEPDSLDLYVKSIEDEGNLFFDEFENIVSFNNMNDVPYIRNLIKIDNDEVEIDIESDITITNHYFLLSKIVYDKNFDPSEYIILIDEVHTIPNIAEVILERKFSLYELKNALLNIETALKNKNNNFYGKNTFSKNITTAKVKALKVHRKHIDFSMVGMFSDDKQKVESVKLAVDDFLGFLPYASVVKKIKQIKDNSKNLLSRDLSKAIEYFLNIHKKGKEIAKLDSQKIGIFYSPSKGFPTLKANVSNPIDILYFRFWKKMDMFACVSATTSYSQDLGFKERLYSYQRLGLYEKDKDIRIFNYDRIFDKNKIKYHIIDENSPQRESVYDKDFSDIKSEYYNYLCDKIAETYDGKNSMVLCGGYKEATLLYNLMALKYKEVKTLCVSPNVKTNQTLKIFKREGGILFATRNYNTGTSLEGELMEKLYILKFPYPDYTSLRWLQNFKKNPNGHFSMLQKEMLIELMQTLGRMQRSDDDEGDIYLLDKRYHSLKINTRKNVDKILDYYAIPYKDVATKKKQTKKLSPEEVKNNLSALLNF